LNPLTVSEIRTIVGAEWLQVADKAAAVDKILTDSRALASPAGTLFFALPGKFRDGHDYVQSLYEQGVRHFVVSRPLGLSQMPLANVLLVPDVLEALQRLAAWHRAQFGYPVIGITGSNGKTVVKEWLAQLLAPDYLIVRSPKSYNSQIGVPLSVWQMQEKHQLAIIEAGISQPGEMEKLERIIRPNIGLFTNLGPAHQEGFASEHQKWAEKMRLFQGAEWLVGRAEDFLPHGSYTVPAAPRLFTWSANPDVPADLHLIKEERVGNKQTLLWAQGKDSPHDIHSVAIPFQDPASVENAMHCWAMMRLLGISDEEVARRMARLEPVEMRLEVKAALNGCTLVNDAYSNDLASLRIALRYARQQAGRKKLTLILSDILQSGQKNEELWASVAEIAQAASLDRLVGIGQGIPLLGPLLPPKTEAFFYPDTAAFLQNWDEHVFQDETVLLKGARSFAFERIARRLEQKAHKTVLEIDLSALMHNLKAYRQLLSPSVKMMAMVKAEGYGAGSAQVAKLLEFQGADYLGVAYTDEGVALREAGVSLPILVLNPEAASFDAIWRYRLEPEVYSLDLLRELAASLPPKNGAPQLRPIHLKLDTGMHRLGFEPSEIPVLLESLKALPHLRVASVFSHLAASDDADHDEFTRRQASAFEQMYGKIKEGLGYAPIRHICNTGGIERWPEFHFDMVRLGIGLYGIGGEKMKGTLRTVNTLKASISQIKHIPAGETVGYGRNSGPLSSPKRIATISIGYADGLLRLAGGGRYAVCLRGKKAPTIGNVCMDMTMIDISHVPEAQVGDEVVIFGENPPVQELAHCLQTIPYEVFTNISERVKRVYWDA
jgi:alanine racemase